MMKRLAGGGGTRGALAAFALVAGMLVLMGPAGSAGAQTATTGTASTAAPAQSGTAVAAPAPGQSVSLQFEGSISYSNSGPLTSGSFSIQPASGPVSSVTGSGSLAGVSGGAANVAVDVHSFFGLYLGFVHVADTGAKVSTTALVLTTQVERLGTSGVSGTAFGFAPSPGTPFGFGLYQLKWSIFPTPPPPLTITTTSLPNGQVGQAYSATVSANGGVPPYTWSATGLPAGLSIDPSSGTISGTPGGSAVAQAPTTGTTSQTGGTSATPVGSPAPAPSPSPVPSPSPAPSPTPVPVGAPVVGTSTVTITVTDSESPAASASATLALTITPAPLTITTTSLPNGQVGQAYSATVSANGGVPPYTWSATGLPAGLSIDPSSGTISGTPSSAGTSTVTITVTDSQSPAATATVVLSLEVDAPQVALSSTSLDFGSVLVGSSAQQSVTVTNTGSADLVIGGLTPTGPFTASGCTTTVAPGAQCSIQVTFSPQSAGAASGSLILTDNAPDSPQTVTLAGTSVAPLAITTGSLPDATVGAQYSDTVFASGGFPPYTWSATGLPTGLSIDPSTGTISGIATAPGVYTVNLVVEDSTGALASRSLSITVSAQRQQA